MTTVQQLTMTMPGRSGVELEAARRVAWICAPLRMNREWVDEVEFAVVEAILALRPQREWGASRIAVTCRLLGNQRLKEFQVRVEYQDTACSARRRCRDTRPALQQAYSRRILKTMMDVVATESTDSGRAIEMSKRLHSNGVESGIRSKGINP